MSDEFLCAGCNVREPWEHRCHREDGTPCFCDTCEGRACHCQECRAVSCGAAHPHYRSLVSCSLPPGHEGRHRADVNLVATGGWVGPMEWDDDGQVFYENHPDPARNLATLRQGDRIAFDNGVGYEPRWFFGRITESATRSSGVVHRIRWEDGFEDKVGTDAEWYRDGQLQRAEDVADVQ